MEGNCRGLVICVEILRKTQNTSSTTAGITFETSTRKRPPLLVMKLYKPIIDRLGSF